MVNVAQLLLKEKDPFIQLLIVPSLGTLSSLIDSCQDLNMLNNLVKPTTSVIVFHMAPSSISHS